MSKLLLPPERATSLILPPDKKWEPLYYTKNNYPFSRGADIADFSEISLTASRGFRKGQPLVFTDWQKWLVDNIFELKPNGFYAKRVAVVGLPRKNGKSLLGTAMALEELMYGGEGVQVYSVAKNRDQAKIVFKEAKDQVDRNPHLYAEIKTYRDTLVNKRTGGIYKALSADGAGAQGLGPSVVIADELHVWEDANGSERAKELWAAITEGSGDRPESLVVAITTAGAHRNTILGELYDKGVKQASGTALEDDPYFGFYWWGTKEGEDITDVDVWLRANPNLAEGLNDLDDMRSSYNKGKTSGFLSFKRYRLNQWVNLSGEPFISEYHWDKAEVKNASIPLGADITVGFDGATRHDITTIMLQDYNTGLLEPYRTWIPDKSNPNWSVDRAEVLEAWREVFRLYNVKMFFGDASWFEAEMNTLDNDFPDKVKRIPQSAARMDSIGIAFVADIYALEATHNGDSLLKEHVMNSLLKPTGSFTKDRHNTNNKNDLLVSAALANGARHFAKTQPEYTGGLGMNLF